MTNFICLTLLFKLIQTYEFKGILGIKIEKSKQEKPFK